MSRRSKLYRARLASVDRQKTYPLDEALQVLKSMPVCKFNETVELSLRLGIDARQSDQAVRGVQLLPRGTGKSSRVVVIAEGPAAEQAKQAGADEVGADELLERIKGGWLDFDVMIATPDAMRKVRTLGRVLGPRGLMPNPKTGTVTEDPSAAVREAKAGRVEFRSDRGGCVHVPIGKLSFDAAALSENAMTVIQAILKARPPTTKGAYLLSLGVSATMSPGVKVDVRSVTKA